MAAIALRVSARHSLDIFSGVVLLLLVLDRQAVAVLVGGQGLEQIDSSQVTLAQDRERVGILDVLQVDSVNALAEDLDGADRDLPWSAGSARCRCSSRSWGCGP